MIVVTIERKTREQYEETQQICVKETPTDKVKSSYGGSSEVAFEREFEAVKVPKERERTTRLLLQEIADEESFNLTAVIQAINNIHLETA
jgi:hypothetical protein